MVKKKKRTPKLTVPDKPVPKPVRPCTVKERAPAGLLPVVFPVSHYDPDNDHSVRHWEVKLSNTEGIAARHLLEGCETKNAQILCKDGHEGTRSVRSYPDSVRYIFQEIYQAMLVQGELSDDSA